MNLKTKLFSIFIILLITFSFITKIKADDELREDCQKLQNLIFTFYEDGIIEEKYLEMNTEDLEELAENWVAAFLISATLDDPRFSFDYCSLEIDYDYDGFNNGTDFEPRVFGKGEHGTPCFICRGIQYNAEDFAADDSLCGYGSNVIDSDCDEIINRDDICPWDPEDNCGVSIFEPDPTPEPTPPPTPEPTSEIIDDDEDGVDDSIDECPGVKGSVFNFGCPIELEGQQEDNIIVTEEIDEIEEPTNNASGEILNRTPVDETGAACNFIKTRTNPKTISIIILISTLLILLRKKIVAHKS